MTRLAHVVVIAAFVASAVVLAGQEPVMMTPADIDFAIRFGQNQKRLSPYELKTGAWPRTTAVAYLTTPFLRVALAAREAKRLYKPFAVADVSSDLLDPLVQIIVPAYTYGHAARLSQPQRVIVLPAGINQPAIEPVWLRTDDHTLQNWFGATFVAQSIVAAFKRADVADGNRVVMVFDGPAPGDRLAYSQEVRVTIRAKDLEEWR